MTTLVETVAMTDGHTKKRSLGKTILNFMLFGGWILVIGVGLAAAIVIDMYVF
jgi:hypothetical protein